MYILISHWQVSCWYIFLCWWAYEKMHMTLFVVPNGFSRHLCPNPALAFQARAVFRHLWREKPILHSKQCRMHIFLNKITNVFLWDYLEGGRKVECYTHCHTFRPYNIKYYTCRICRVINKNYTLDYVMMFLKRINEIHICNTAVLNKCFIF